MIHYAMISCFSKVFLRIKLEMLIPSFFQNIKVDLDTVSLKALAPSLNDTKEQLHSISYKMGSVEDGIKLKSNDDMVAISIQDDGETELPLRITKYLNVPSEIMEQEEDLHDQEDLTTASHHATRDCEAKEVSEITKEYFLDEDTSIRTDNTQFFPRNDTVQGNSTSDLTAVLSPEVLDNENDEYRKKYEENWNLELNISYQNGFEPSSICIGDLSPLLSKQKRNGIHTCNNVCACLAIKETDRLCCENCVYTKHRKSLKKLHMVIQGICGSTESQNDLSSNLEIKKREVCELKHELQFIRTSVMPLHVLWMTGDLLWHHKLNKVFTQHVNFNSCHDTRTQPSDVIGQLLQGLKMTFNGKSCNHSKNSYGVNGQRRISEDLVDQFFRAIKLIPIQQDNAYEMLDKFCHSIQSASIHRALVHRIFTRSELIGYSRTSKHNTSENLEIVLLAFDYILQHKKTSGLFAMSFLEIFMNSIECVIPVISLRPEVVEAVIQKAVNQEIWDEDKVAEVFILLCDALVENVSLLCRCVDVILSTAFTRHRWNKMALGSCILVRMGLLKSEFDVNICRQLKGALLALEHVFSQEYFPTCLAGLFSSFLVKPSPRFRKVNLPRKKALKAAMLKEILQPTMSLGKGLKRICDVLAQGEFWETALRCSEALVEESFTVNTTFTPMEQGSSVLVYFGLIKSEFPVHVLKNVHDGLKLLRHAAERGDIPQSIAPMLVIFFKKSSSKMHLYKEEVEELLKLLTK